MLGAAMARSTFDRSSRMWMQAAFGILVQVFGGSGFLAIIKFPDWSVACTGHSLLPPTTRTSTAPSQF